VYPRRRLALPCLCVRLRAVGPGSIGPPASPFPPVRMPPCLTADRLCPPVGEVPASNIFWESLRAAASIKYHTQHLWNTVHPSPPCPL